MVQVQDSAMNTASPLARRASRLLIDQLLPLAPWTALRVERIADPRPCSLEAFGIGLAIGRLTGYVVIVPDLVDWTDGSHVAAMADAIAGPFLDGGK